jgi:hypothetical protein
VRSFDSFSAAKPNPPVRRGFHKRAERPFCFGRLRGLVTKMAADSLHYAIYLPDGNPLHGFGVSPRCQAPGYFRARQD